MLKLLFLHKDHYQMLGDRNLKTTKNTTDAVVTTVMTVVETTVENKVTKANKVTKVNNKEIILIVKAKTLKSSPKTTN